MPRKLNYYLQPRRTVVHANWIRIELESNSYCILKNKNNEPIACLLEKNNKDQILVPFFIPEKNKTISHYKKYVEQCVENDKKFFHDFRERYFLEIYVDDCVGLIACPTILIFAKPSNSMQKTFNESKASLTPLGLCY